MATDRPQPSAFKFVAALIIYLAPLVILGAGFAVYQFYQAENMRIAQMRVDEERNQASRFVEILEQYATSSREQVMAAAETHLATLPLPLDELPLMQLRELPLTLTERAFTNGKLTLVSVNPEHRQFYYENRNTNNDFVFLATLGETIGPQAVGTDGAYYMLLVAPTSNNNWVVVAELPGEALQVAFEASLAPESSVALRQAGSISDQLSLFELGPSHSGPASTTIDHGDWSIDYWPATGEYTVTNNTQQLLPLLYTLATGFFVSVLLILLRIRANLRRAAALEDEDDTELFSQTQIRSAAELSSRSASSSAFGQDQNSLSTPATNDALTRPPAQHLETPLGQTDHYSLVRAPDIPTKIFRANDIRGLVEVEITENFAFTLGAAFASFVMEQGADSVRVCRDSRPTSENLARAFIAGVTQCGCQAFDLGLGPTPLLGFAVQETDTPGYGAMITASHNPPEYNGFKLYNAGAPATAQQIGALRERMIAREFSEGSASCAPLEVQYNYLQAIRADIAPMPGFIVVIDGGNGAAGELAHSTFNLLGCTVHPLFCEPDGTFPNRGPDPSKPENVLALRDKVRETRAHLGVAFDGDGDRLVAVGSDGNVIPPDHLMMILATQVLIDNPASTVIYDVKCSALIPQLVRQLGGEPICQPSGRSFMHNALHRYHAKFAGEYSSHYILADRWNVGDDALYAACRLAEQMYLNNQSLAQLCQAFPQMYATAELAAPVSDSEKFSLVERIAENASFSGATLITIDGLRVEYPHGWGLVRASNTTPALTIRFEADSKEALEHIQTTFKQQLLALEPTLELPF